ncbi:DUF3347 domain-containing protein [Fulvivirga lutea]|uniref:DUF3347 domain-containing protein n=1 Tax=Fulvivirga lutea TaxID=2810512 RepID=A0A974WHR6_9BACT|nr:DUF3347 domain-containing protein [Fulvivirga lutea]QSE98773.1 DUF3347 domain-containing protein [Fulvivirga lutea]
MKTTLLSIATVSLLMACGAQKGEEKETTTEATTEVKEEATSEEAATDSSAELVQAYMKLKDALVATNGAEAKAAATEMHNVITENDNQGELMSAAMKISNTEDVEEQRKAFLDLTAAFIAHVKANGSDETLYVQYCPMAFDNNGGNWVSLSSEIRNPYFGDKMLKCGKVEEEI